MSRTAFGISWIDGELRIVRLVKGLCAATWIAPKPVNDLTAFNHALSHASTELDMRRGGKAFIAFRSEQLSHVLLEIPPMTEQDMERFFKRHAEQDKPFPEAAVWSRQIARQSNKRNTVLLHILPKPFVDAVIRICEEFYLVPKRLAPLTDMLAQHIAASHLADNELLLLVGLFKQHTQMAVALGAGDVLFVRDLNYAGARDACQRMGVDINRTALYAKQRFGSAMTRALIIGPDAAAIASELSHFADIKVEADIQASDPFFWAKRVCTLPKDCSNFVPALAQHALSSHHLLRTAVYATAAMLPLSVTVTMGVEWLIAQNSHSMPALQAQIAALEQEKAEWEIKLSEIDALKSRLDSLTTASPPLPGWFLGYLSKVIPKGTALHSAQMTRENNAWRFDLHGVTALTLSDTVTALEHMEKHLADPPWNVEVSPNWRLAWLEQLRNGQAAHKGATNFVMEGMVR